LVLDRAALDRNLAAMQSRCDAAGVWLRAHGKMHKCSTLAKRQVALGAAGLCAQTIGEAETFAAAGIPDVLITAPIAPQSAARAAALAKLTTIAATADDPRLVEALGAAARAAGVTVGLVVDVDLGQHRTGCTPEDAVALARLAAKTDGLRYDGVQAYVGHLQHIGDVAARKAANDGATRRLADLVAALKADGLAPRLVTGGGTGTHAWDLAGGVFNEIQAGSYAVMDAEYDACGGPDGAWPFEAAMFVAARVISTRHKSHLTIDAGLKALSTDGPVARVVSGAEDGAVYRPMGDEHGAIYRSDALPFLKEAGRDPLAFERAIDKADADLPSTDDMAKIGDTVWLQPGHCDPTINLYDAFLVWDGAGWERWPIDARRTTAL